MTDEAEESNRDTSYPEKRATLGFLLGHHYLSLAERQQIIYCWQHNAP